MSSRCAAVAVWALCGLCRPLWGAEQDPRVAQLLARMTLAEKIALLHGAKENPATDQGQAGYLPGVPRLGIPSLRLADGPPGVLTRYPSTALTATMGLAATFSREDAHANGVVIAHDAKALGIDVVLEPYINIHRDQTFGRAYNTYGEDPLLSGAIGAALIQGVQGEGVMAQAKHFIAYDGANNVTVDAQTLHEIYLAPFAAAVDADVSSIMCSYNLINMAYACGNDATLNGVLRGELGFKGFVTSDWGAVHGTQFINAGLDLEMPGTGADAYFPAPVPVSNKKAAKSMLAPPHSASMPEEPTAERMTMPSRSGAAPIGLPAALKRGLVSRATIDTAVGRILAQMERFDLLNRSPRAAVHPEVDAQLQAADDATVLQTSEHAAVLLRNQDGALPLTSADLNSLAMIGPGAQQDIAIGGAGEKALGHVEREIGAADALYAVAQAQPADADKVHIVRAVADDMSGTAVPAMALRHPGGAGLARHLPGSKSSRIDRQLEFTRASANALPAGSHVRWTGQLQVPTAGRYRLYLQVLGASGELDLDGKPVAVSSSLQLHGNVLQPAQDNVLPSRDGLDNVRNELELAAGTHALAVRVDGDASGQPVQVRFAWVTPEQRRADYEQALASARAAHTAVVFAWSRGKPSFQLPGDQDQLIDDVASANPNTIVVLNVSEPISMPWLEKVRAVLLMWYPGDEGGRATAELLLGRADPGGRLPFTWPKQLEQNLANAPTNPERSSSGVAGRTRYSEGIFVGYRWFDQQQIEPLFPFGYGLSYTRFDYADLSAGLADDGGLDATFQLHNMGTVAGDEVPQLYLGPPQPAPTDAQFAQRSLIAFERVHLEPGETKQVHLHAAARSLQYWSATANGWRTAMGSRAVSVAASSRDPRLQAVISIGAQ